MLTRCLALIVFLLVVVSGCAPQTVRSQAHPALAEAQVTRVAVVPFTAAGRLAQAAATGAEADRARASLATALVARHITEGIAARGIEVVAPEDVGRALEAAGIDRSAAGVRSIGDLASRKFGADAIVIGRVSRFVEREGQAAGATRPASVGFQVSLHSAPVGARLWTAGFDETQRPLTENVFNASRYPGGGSRWLTVEELTRWGAREVAASLPTGAQPATR